MGKTRDTGFLTDCVFTDSSNNVGIGAAASGSYKLQVTGTTNVTGVLTLGSTISNGTNTYTLPSATGTLALTSNLSAYLPLIGGTLTGPLGGTSATFSGSLTVTNANINISNAYYLSARNNANSAYLSLIGRNTSDKVVIDPDGYGVNIGGAATFSSSVTAGAGSFTASSGWGLQGYSNNSASFNAANGSGYGLYINSGTSASSSTYTAQFVGNGSTQFYIRGDGNVGIGTSSPLFSGFAQLTVNGTQGGIAIQASSTGYSRLFFAKDDTSNVEGLIRYYHSDNSMQFFTSATERMRITSGGNVLIGTSTDDGLSLHKLQVNGYSRAVQWRSYENGQDVAYGGGFYQQSTSGTTYAVATLMGSAGQMRFWTFNPSDSFQNRMTLTNSGNLLIGTTSDNGSKLQISGSTSITGNLTIGSPSSALAQFHIYNASAAASMLVQTNSAADYSEIAARNYNQTSTCYYRQYSSSAGGTDFGASRSNLAALFSNYASNLAIGTQNGGNLIFGTGNTERMRISTTGAVSIVGSLSKGSGSFRIDHPLESMTETHQLVHSFVEAPQADLYYRGKLTLVNGKAQANIDEVATMTEGTFEVLCREVQCFTTNETGWDLVKGKVIGNIIYIESQNPNSTDEISWLVIGERKDKHMMDTEWTDDNGRVIVEPLKEKLK